ncbi:MAG: 7TM diverse intracellular signaling domain-containing protein [Cyclobacteriaceae bacterium]
MSILILLLSALTTSSHSQGTASEDLVLVVEDTEIKRAGSYIYYLEDIKGTWSIDEIVASDKAGKFQPIQSEIFNKLPTNTVFWFKLTVQNLSEQDLWLEIGDAFSTWYLDFYEPDSKGQYKAPLLLGALRPQKNKKIPSNVYCAPLSKADNQNAVTYFFRVESYFPETHIFKTGSLEMVVRDLKIKEDFAMVYVGIMLAMIIYNFFLLISLKEVVNFYYLTYLVLILIGGAFSQGYPLFYSPWMWHYYLTFQLFVAIAIFLFTVKYLDLYRISKNFYWFLAFLCFLIVLAGVINIIFPDQFTTILNFVQPVLFINNLSTIAISIIIWRQGYRGARFFVFGWAFAIMGILIFILSINGVLPINDFTSNTLFLGFSLEAVMFGLALGDRLNILKREKELLQLNNLNLIKKQKDHLEELIDEKTRELREAYNSSSKLNTQLTTYNQKLNQQKTELVSALQQKDKVQSKLIESEKMASLGILVAGIGHEINNPLNFIKGGATALGSYLQKEKKHYRKLSPVLDAIHEGVRRCSAIIESLSQYSRQGGDMEESCDIEAIIENCLVILENKLRHKIQIKKNYLPASIQIKGNAGKLHQVFLNILTNAEQAIENEGLISITISKNSQNVIVTISDNGSGISKENLKRISDPFFTTKPPGIGTGLGLSITYSIVNEHKGAVSCESTVGSGTAFEILLPL